MSDRTGEHAHADLDLLADVLAGEADAAVLEGCADCLAALADLEAGDALVAAALAALPAPVLPADLVARLDAALTEAATTAGTSAGAGAAPASAEAGTATVTTLPDRAAATKRSGPPAWLGAAAAAVLLLGGAAVGVVTLGGGAGDDAVTAGPVAGSDAALRGLVRNDTGSAYSAGNLPAAVPGLLSGDARQVGAPEVAAGGIGAPTSLSSRGSGGATTGSTGGPGQVPAPYAPYAADASAKSAADAALARLRTEAGLADCLVALLPPDDDSVVPLALDYGTFAVDGKAVPALLVVLPVPGRDDKLDVFVVGAGCAQADEQLLHFARVDAP